MKRGLPRYYQAARQLEAMIREQDLQIGDLLPSERQLTEQLKMSRVTVRKALEELELAGTIDKQWGRGSVVARLPSEEVQASDRLPCLGMVLWMVPGITQHPALAEYLQGMHDVFPPNQYEIKMIFITPHMIEADDYPPALYGEGVDGLFINIHELPAAVIEHLDQLGLPRVFDNVPEHRPCVFMDYEESACRLTRHLLDLGHQRIGLIMGDNEYLDKAVRQGYAQALRQRSIMPDPALLVSGSFDEASGHRLAHEMLTQARPTALIMGDDFMVLGALQAIRELEMDCPRDVSVACFGGLYPSRYASPPLTVMQVPRQELGQHAAMILKRQLAGEHVRESDRIHMDLIVRESTSRVPQSRPVAHK